MTVRRTSGHCAVLATVGFLEWGGNPDWKEATYGGERGRCGFEDEGAGDLDLRARIACSGLPIACSGLPIGARARKTRRRLHASCRPRPARAGFGAVFFGLLLAMLISSLSETIASTALPPLWAT